MPTVDLYPHEVDPTRPCWCGTPRLAFFYYEKPEPGCHVARVHVTPCERAWAHSSPRLNSP